MSHGARTAYDFDTDFVWVEFKDIQGALYASKIDVSNSVTYLNWISIFEWYVVMCGSKNGYQKDMCLTKIGLHAHNMITILDSTVNI